MNKLKSIILSKKFIPVIFAFFLAQAVFYSVTIDYSIPSDEDFHYESIKYYADQPITDGPLIANQSPDTIKAVNAIERSPKFLYHYLLSFPQRGFDAFGMSEDVQILIFRLISIAMAFASLIILKKIFDELTEDTLIKNVALTALVLTGMFVWLSAAISYDNLANLLFLLFVLLIIRFIRAPDWTRFIAITTVGMAAILTKHTFLPMFILGLAISLLYIVKRKPQRSLAKVIKKANFKVILLLIIFLLTSFLLVARIGGNLVQYGSVSPKCEQLFTTEQCGVYRVTARNYKQQADYTAEEKNRIVRDWDPFTHTGIWTYKMYNSLPWYLGHQRIESNFFSEISAAILAALFGVTILFSRSRIYMSRQYKVVIAFASTYLLALYLFNLNTYFSIGHMNAYQGRYLLPVLGFFLLFAVTLALNSYRNMRGFTKILFSYLWVVTVAVYIIMHFTPLLFYIGTDATWFDGIPPPYY